MKLHPRLTARDGFTLVELLVAMALIILIMAILSAAFSVSLDTFSQLKAIGDMSEQLRSANTIIRRDLAADHFEDEAENRHRLSAMPTAVAWDGSKKGFFYIRQDSAGVPEGTDADSIPSVRVSGPTNTPPQTPGFHEFGMTVRLPAKTHSDTFASLATPAVRAHLGNNSLVDFSIVDATGTPVQMVTRWAEVYYFLRQTSVETTDANGVRVPLYTLYRRQRVVSPNTVVFPNQQPPGPPPLVTYTNDMLPASSLAMAQVPLGTLPAQPPQFMAVGPDLLNVFVNPSPPNVYLPANRLGGWYDPHRQSRPGYPATPPPQQGQTPVDFATPWRPYPIPNIPGVTNTEYGSDVVLNNVVSFRVQIQDGTGQFQDLPTNLGNPVGTFPRVYDTARPAPPTGTKPQIRAIRIQLRIYSANSSLTRQVSIVQDM